MIGYFELPNIRNFVIDLIYQVNTFAPFGQFGWMIGVRNEELSKKFGARFRKLREATGLSTREFADTAGIAYSQVWSIETGKGNPTLGTLDAIAKTLNMSIDELLSGL